MKNLILPLMVSCLLLGCFPASEEVSAVATENPTQTVWGNPTLAENAKVVNEENAKVVNEENPGGLRKGLTLRQRRAMGLTYKNIKTIVERKQVAGELADIDACCLAVEIADELFDGNPQAFADPALDWDAILEFLEKLIPFILKIIALFS